MLQLRPTPAPHPLSPEFRSFMTLLCGGPPTESQVEEFATSEVPQLRLFAAADSSCPVPTIGVLARDDEPAIRVAIAHRLDASADVLHRLSQDPDEKVRAAVALNPSLAEPAVVALSDDTSPVVRTQLATRRNLPERVGARLLLDTSVSVLVAMAARPDLDKAARNLLARRHQLISHLAKNPALDPSDLRLFVSWSLAQEDGQEVWSDLLRNPSLPLSGLATLYVPVRTRGSAAQNRLLNRHPLLSSVPLHEVLTLVTEGNDALREQLLFLAIDDSTPFGSYVAGLITDINEELRDAAASDDLDGEGLTNDLVLLLAPHYLMWEPAPVVM